MDISELTAEMHRFVQSQGWYEQNSLRPQTLKNLAISLVLLIGLTLIVLALGRVGLQEQIITGNEQRALKVHDAAEAGVEYGMKVPMWPWLGLKPVIEDRQRWHRMNSEISYFETTLPIEPWQRELRVVVYRKRVWHLSPKNYQLDLFDPNDGHYEYHAMTTNKGIGPVDLWHFMAGRGAHEKTIEELKNGFAFDSVPTNHYGANSAWQQLSVLALNLFRCFQMETGAARRPRSRKRTYVFTFESVKSARFKWLNVAGRLVRPNGKLRLRLADVPATRRCYDRIGAALARAA